MRALPRGAAASLLRAAAAAAPCRPRPVQLQRRLPDADRLLAMVRVLPPSPHPLHSSSDPSCVGCPILCGILIAVCLQNIPAVCFSRYSTLVTPSDEVLVPPELLSSRTVGTPERKIGQYEDLVARITNFTMRIRATWCWMVMYLMFQSGRTLFIELYVGNLLNGNSILCIYIKPYKQKGTGRARHGTLRGPQFRGGATMHGPKPRSHAIKLQKKVRRLGLKIALSARTAEGKLLVFEDLEVPSHKTKNVVSYISQMEDTKKVLLVDGGDIDKKLKLATQNLHYVNVLPSIGLNVYSILQHDTLWLKVGGGWVAARARDGAAVGGSGKMFCRYQHVRCSREAGVYTS
ncbi:Os12g0488600 [Oryza sativa Japonica Group]|uniref:Large ribosomal subunit protein uL4m n=1 Tax=Oryza sativa subsp. japonica TaxID=39947 RepID=Q0INA7_ORYSJ|nr:Os12g0488600 [Oryza sativa Japonica Group]|eukprot:NP_001066789.2 Os12g0488600 [Oryza sativa Japonica Group]